MQPFESQGKFTVFRRSRIITEGNPIGTDCMIQARSKVQYSGVKLDNTSFDFIKPKKNMFSFGHVAGIFAETISTTPDSSDLHAITANTVEYVRLVATALPESLVDGKFHAFKLSLPADYVANSSNPKKDTLSFKDSEELHSSIGKLQLVPPSFSDLYEAKVYYGGNGTKSNGTRIPLLDERSWYLDYFNGILFQEVPPDEEHVMQRCWSGGLLWMTGP